MSLEIGMIWDRALTNHAVNQAVDYIMAQPDGKQSIARLSNVTLTLFSPLSIRHELSAWNEARSLLHFGVRDPWGGYFGVGLVHASPRCGRLINLYYLPDTAISFSSSNT